MKLPIRSIAASASVAMILTLSGVAPLLANADATSAPTVTISSASSDPTSDNPIMFAVTVSSSTGAFSASNLSVQGGAVVNFLGSGTNYTFGVVPGDGDPVHGSQPRLVSVQVIPNSFDNNVGSNYISRWYDPAAASTASTSTSTTTTTTSTGTTSTASTSSGATIATSSLLMFTSGPTDGTTIDTGTIGFGFTGPQDSTFMCSLNSSTPWMCSSPQNFVALPNGSYNFMVEASGVGVASTSISTMFIVSTSSLATTTDTSGSTATSTATTTDTTTNTSSSTSSTSSGSSSGGSVTPAPSGGGGGVGNNGSLGAPTGNTVVPSGGAVLGASTGPFTAVIPTAPTTAVVPHNSSTAVTPGIPNTGVASASAKKVSTAARSTGSKLAVSTGAGGSALVGGSAATSNTGTNYAVTSDSGSAPTSAFATSDNSSSSLAAAAADASGGIPGWVWIVLLGVILVAIGVWALRQPVM